MDRKQVGRRVAALTAAYVQSETPQLLEAMIKREFPGEIAVVSSFGTESAVLLSLVAEVDPTVPVIFLETGKLYDETRRYRDHLTAALGLENLRIVGPRASELAALDAKGSLWAEDPDACCRIRKVEPLARALAEFPAWITGRKRYQGESRAALPLIEAAAGRVKINPLATWSRDQLEAAFVASELPAHPLAGLGFSSIGCMPCSRPVRPGEDPRAGRWSWIDKTECGIHLDAGSAI